MTTTTREPGATVPAPEGLPPALLEEAFPFALVLDRDLRLVRVGRSVPRVLPGARPGAGLHDLVRVAFPPRLEPGFEGLRRRPRTLFVLRPVGGGLPLRGQVVCDDAAGLAYFVGSPVVDTVHALTRHGLTLGDFAVSDPVVDYVFLLQAQATSLADATRLARELQEAAEEQARLAAAEQSLARELDALPDLVLRLRGDGTVLQARPALDEDLPAPAAELVGTSALVAFPEMAHRLGPALARAFETGRVVDFDYTRLGPEPRHHEARVVRCADDAALVLVRDVTTRRELERRLRHQADSDPLTGLANRARFARAVAERRSLTVSLLFVDLDDFKRVNDSLGHAAGDELLVQIAARLRSAVRPGDLVARLGGDEFAVLLDPGHPDDARGVAARVLAELDRPCTVQGVEVRAGASIGTTVGDDAATADELLRRADVAMYTAKRAGGGRASAYDALLEGDGDRLLVEQELRRAVAEGTLHLAYQPVVDVRDGRVLGVEALARWDCPGRGPVPPAEFVPLAEATGLVDGLGDWVLHRACRQVAAWREQHPELSVNVNLSPRQLVPGLADRVAEVLAESGLPGSALVVEVTETALGGERAEAVAVLAALRRLEVQVALDDFGTGWSSLSRLRDLPLDELKVDRAFVAGLVDDPAGVAIARAVAELGRALGLRVVAEGVETSAQLDVLRTCAVDRAQGHLFGAPRGAAETAARLDRWSGRLRRHGGSRREGLSSLTG